MNVTVERMPESQVRLTIEIDAARVESSLNQAYKRIAPRAKVPGFRPGKAPRALIERHYGRETLLNEALDRLVPEVVAEAIKAEAIEIIDQPDLEITNLDPVTVTATVPVKPTITLGDYRTVRVERAAIAFDAEEVDKSLEDLRRRYATVEPVERAVEDGDVIRLDLKAESEGEPLLEQEDAELVVSADQLPGLPGLHAKLLGLAPGTTETFDVEAAEDAGELAGKTITYTVTLKDVKAQTLPELDDEFAKEVGESFPTLASLRERIETDIKTRRENEADEQLQEQALAQMLSQATLEFPPQLVEREVERMLRDQGVPSNDRKTLERMLRRAGFSEEQLRKEFRPAAAERVRRSLVLNSLREAEGIDVTPDEVEAELERMGAGINAEQIRKMFDTDTGRDAIRSTLMSRRTLERLRLIARGEAPELSAPATDAVADRAVLAEATEATPETLDPPAPVAAAIMTDAPSEAVPAEAASSEAVLGEEPETTESALSAGPAPPA